MTTVSPLKKKKQTTNKTATIRCSLIKLSDCLTSQSLHVLTIARNFIKKKTDNIIPNSHPSTPFARFLHLLVQTNRFHTV